MDLSRQSKFFSESLPVEEKTAADHEPSPVASRTPWRISVRRAIALASPRSRVRSYLATTLGFLKLTRCPLDCSRERPEVAFNDSISRLSGPRLKCTSVIQVTGR